MTEWRCFHCDELFTTRQAAQDHFGLDELELPGCVQVLTETERALVADRREWRRRAHTAEAEVETLEHRLSSEGWELRRFGPEVRTIHQAWLEHEGKVGELLAAEEKVRFLIERLLASGVPWVSLPHDDRTPEQILGHPVDYVLAPDSSRSTSDVITGLLGLHARMLPSRYEAGERSRPVEIRVDARDADAVLRAALLLERARVASKLTSEPHEQAGAAAS